jgi:hypothetical protein
MNRALVVGIGNYGRLGQPLPGCANDLAGWQGLVALTLDASGANLRVRADAQATRGALLNDLHWLLSDVSAGDQRVFFFAGHGARLHRRDPQTGIVDAVMDETLVAYPGEDGDYETFMLFDSDLKALIDQSGFPDSARLTLIVDACHSGGIDRPFIIDGEEDDNAYPRCLRVDEEVAAREFDFDAPVVRAFGSLEAVDARRVIVAAAAATESAWDARMTDGNRHGVFSYHAVRAISGQPAISFDQLIAAVTPPIAGSFPQHPVLLGDNGRFAGTIFN